MRLIHRTRLETVAKIEVINKDTKEITEVTFTFPKSKRDPNRVIQEKLHEPHVMFKLLELSEREITYELPEEDFIKYAEEYMNKKGEE